MKTICLVIPYFGKWPKWFNIYLETCRHNPTVDWLFFTDCDIPKEKSQNIKFFKMQLDDFNALASKKLGLKISIKENFRYKLVDFKPAYGMIFEDYLKNYDFWGCSDVDVIYGDIRRFITDDILETYDIISAKKQYLVGHFTLYKNCDKINRLYQKTRDYKNVFRYVDTCYSFSECGKDWMHRRSVFDGQPIRKRILNPIMRAANKACSVLGCESLLSLTREVESMTECVKRLEKEGYLKSFFKTVEIGYKAELAIGGDWKFYWEKGRLTYLSAGREFMYFHFYYKRMGEHERFLIPGWDRVPEKFFITKEGFFTEEETSEITQEAVHS